MKRKEFIKNAGLLCASGLLVKDIFGKNNEGQHLAVPSSLTSKKEEPLFHENTFLGLYEKERAAAEFERIIHDKIGLDWLSKGDSVLLKVSSNSANLHPAVTLPASIGIMVKILKDAGAGEVIVGDQAGAQHVRMTQTFRKSSTKEIFAKNGILKEIESSSAKMYCFDDYGWDSYYHPDMEMQNLWNNELYMPKIIKEVDHIVYLSRLSSHCYSGYSGGLKNAVGFLRDDSRLSLHRDGEHFHQKVAEISCVPDIKNKLRLSVTLADKALLHFGPDMGKVHELKKMMVLVSDNAVQHDYLAAAVLNWYNKKIGSAFKYMPTFHFPNSMSWNNFLVKSLWGKEERVNTTAITPFIMDGTLENHPTLYHYCKMVGCDPEKFNIAVDGSWDESFKAYLKEFGGGRFCF
jgi:uncharacterized protein (DUF362 family)